MLCPWPKTTISIGPHWEAKYYGTKKMDRIGRCYSCAGGKSQGCVVQINECVIVKVVKNKNKKNKKKSEEFFFFILTTNNTTLNTL